MLERKLAVGSKSVCLSHAGNASKLMNLGSYGFTDGCPETVVFVTNFHTLSCRDS